MIAKLATVKALAAARRRRSKAAKMKHAMSLLWGKNKHRNLYNIASISV
jgi:hypothetical protein